VVVIGIILHDCVCFSLIYAANYYSVLFSVVIYVLMWKMTLQLGFSSIDELFYICVGGGSIGNDEEGNEHDFE
jgi:hypothetical protein